VTPLEDELRGSLARQAGHASSARTDPDQLADRAIRRARRLRRGRRFSAAATALALIGLAGLGLVQLPERRAAPPVAEPSRPALLTPAAQVPPTVAGDVPGRLYGRARAVPRLPIDVVADDQLVTVDGSAIDLSFAGEVSQAYRVAEGWLVVGGPTASAGTSVWLVTAVGRPQALLSDVAGVAFDVDGRRVAWRSGGRVFLGTLAGGRLSTPVRSALVGKSSVPVGFVAGAVLLARGGAGGYDVWWPERGVYHPAWARTAVAVYGSLADRRTAVGQVVVDATTIDGAGVGERRCLALFDAAFQSVARASRSRAQAPIQTRCGLGLGARSPGWVSPDGRWLVTGAAGRTVLVDLTAQAPAKPLVLSAGPPRQGGVAWLDKQTVVLATNFGKAVMRLRVDQLRGKQADGAKQRSVPVGAKEAVRVVPRL
jgi:hypothetical protein